MTAGALPQTCGTSHLLRLFGQHTGSTFRLYQQWTRLCTQSRAWWQDTFGLSPSALLNSRVQIDLDAIEP